MISAEEMIARSAGVDSNGREVNGHAALVLEAAESGNLELDYANRLAEVLPPIRTCGNQWHAYRDGAWSEIDRASLRPKAQEILPTRIRFARVESAILEHLEGRFQTPSDAWMGFCKFDGDDVLLNAANGVLRVRSSGEITIEQHSPNYLFTKRLAGAYDPNAEAPLFHRVLSEALPDGADQNLLQLLAGNFFYPDCRHEAAGVFHGEAGRGKSTIAEAIVEPIGKALVPRLSMSQICDPRSYHVPKLRFAAVNVSTELDTIDVGDSAAFKAIVSGEPLEARPIYGSPFTMSTGCKLWFLANSLPRFKHGTAAELRRMRFLRFDYLPPRKDPTLKSRLLHERDGVFRWMLAGLVELLNANCIPSGGEHSREVHARFAISNDPVGSFVAQRCHLDPQATVSKDTLRNAYTEFCAKNELPDSIGAWFFRTLRERWPALKDYRRNDGGERTMCVAGIQLKP